MKTIKQITIKSESGYRAILAMYTDRLTVTKDSIRYEYRPFSTVFADKWGWSYRTTAAEHKDLFCELEKIVPTVLESAEEYIVLDAGDIELIVTYEDGTKAKREITNHPTGYDSMLDLLRRMIPMQNRAMPMILQEEDEDEEEEPSP